MDKIVASCLLIGRWKFEIVFPGRIQFARGWWWWWCLFLLPVPVIVCLWLVFNHFFMVWDLKPHSCNEILLFQKGAWGSLQTHWLRSDLYLLCSFCLEIESLGTVLKEFHPSFCSHWGESGRAFIHPEHTQGAGPGSGWRSGGPVFKLSLGFTGGSQEGYCWNLCGSPLQTIFRPTTLHFKLTTKTKRCWIYLVSLLFVKRSWGSNQLKHQWVLICVTARTGLLLSVLGGFRFYEKRASDAFCTFSSSLTEYWESCDIF